MTAAPKWMLPKQASTLSRLSPGDSWGRRVRSCHGFLVTKTLLFVSVRTIRKTKTMDYRHIITIEPGKRSGKPCIRGMRITVYDVLDYLASDMSVDDILRDFPDLKREDIRACLAYAADRERRLMSVHST